MTEANHFRIEAIKQELEPGHAYRSKPIQPSHIGSLHLAGRHGLALQEDRMDRDIDKQPDEILVEETDSNDGVILDKAWAKVDFHDEQKTPEADLPADIEAEDD